MLTDIGILVVLVLLNGLLSLSEMAVVSVNINKVKLMAEQGDKKSALLKKIKEDTSVFLSTIQIGISFLTVFTGAYGANIFAVPLYNALSIEYSLNANLLPLIILAITIIISYFTLLFGELIPKRLAAAKSMEISRTVVEIIYALSFIFRPVIKLLSISTELFVKIFRIKESDDEDITEEEIRMMVDASGETGGIDESELEMINNVFEFDDKTASDILTHRTRLVSLPVDCSSEELINVVVNERFSRIPVYEDTIDNIVGILYTHDLLEYILKENGIGEIDIKTIIRKPYFVPESKKTDELFKQMQKDKVHMSVVVDEYGGTVGIVTMEDLIEEIMGNILDEFDDEERPDIEAIDENTYLINGTLDLTDLANFFKVQLPDDEYDTLSGFFIGQLGHIPLDGERPEIEFNGILFKVYEMDEKRIKSIIVCRIA